MFRGNFQVLNMRWQVQKLVFVTPADMIDQKYHSKQMTQRQKCSKTAVEVEKKVTAFGKNIHLEKFQPYGWNFSGWIFFQNIVTWQCQPYDADHHMMMIII